MVSSVWQHSAKNVGEGQVFSAMFPLEAFLTVLVLDAEFRARLSPLS